MPKQFVSEKDILPLLGISSRSLFELRKKEKIPFQKANARVIRYDPEAVMKAWEELHYEAKGK
jgi:hypothetical protein